MWKSASNSASVWANQPKPKAPFEKPANHNAVEDLPLMYELIALALQTDSTRIATLEIGGDFMPQHLGIKKDYHAPLASRERPGRHREPDHAGEVSDHALRQVPHAPREDERRRSHAARLHDRGLRQRHGRCQCRTRTPTCPSFSPAAATSTASFRNVTSEGSHKVPLCNLFVDIAQKMGVETDHFGSSTGRFA